MTCDTGRLRRQWQRKLDAASDKGLISIARTNDTATAVRESKGEQGPQHRMWRRLIKQELAKRGLGT